MGLARLAGLLGGCLLLASLCACQKQIPLPNNNAQFFTLGGEPISEADFAPFFRGADFILVGENHLNSCDHAIQARLLRLAGQERPDLLVGMEMLFPDQQPVLDAFFERKVHLNGLEQALDWKGHWGHSFASYRPVFAAVREKRLRLYPLSLPRGQIRRMAGGQELVDFPFVPACSQQTEYLRGIFATHKAMLGPGAHETRFLKTQALWDSAMAWKAMQVSRKGPVFILAGSGHVENGWGIEYRLRQLCPSASIIRFTPIRTTAELRQFQQDNFDLDTTAFFFLCPKEVSSSRQTGN